MKTSLVKNGKIEAKIAPKSKPSTKRRPRPPLPLNAGWKKVKIAGNLMSDDGGIGLEGLLGLEVLENFGGPIARQNIRKVNVLAGVICMLHTELLLIYSLFVAKPSYCRHRFGLRRKRREH